MYDSINTIRYYGRSEEDDLTLRTLLPLFCSRIVTISIVALHVAYTFVPLFIVQ